MNTCTKAILFALTAVLLFVSMLQKGLNWPRFRSLKGVVVEASKPKLTIRNCCDGSFQQQVEPYLKQHCGCREPLIRLYNQYLWDFYGTSSVDKEWVFWSDDGWIYESGYVREFYEGLSWEYAADSLEMAEKMGKEALWICQVQQILDRFGTKLFVLLEPGKELVYPEHIPENHDYSREKVISAYDFYRERLNALGVNCFDAAEWFLRMKDTVVFPLFPQTGTHWSNLASMYVGDSLIRYMEDLGDMNILNFSIGKKQSETREPDDDLERLLNLIRPLDKAPNYYAETEVIPDFSATMPRLITIGDSFYWNILNHTPFKKVFGGVPYWYYFSTVYFGGPESSVADIDIVEQAVNSDFVMLAYSTPQLYEMSNGFSLRFLMEWYYDEDDIVKANDDMLRYMRSEKNWMGALTERAERQGKPIDSVLATELRYFAGQHPEVCYPALKDTIPTRQSSKARRLIAERRNGQTERLFGRYETLWTQCRRHPKTRSSELGFCEAQAQRHDIFRNKNKQIR